jgi:CheY-like chemotaxis protein
MLFAGDDEDTSPALVGPPWLILVVDDEEEVHSATGFVLSSQSRNGRRFTLESAYSGKQALERVLDVTQPMPHLILMDVVMDHATDGIDAVRQIREIDDSRGAPYIIVRTGQPGDERSSLPQLQQDPKIDCVLLKAQTTGAMLVNVVNEGLRTAWPD